MVVRLSEALGMPIRERNDLLLAAGFAPAYPESRLDDPSLAPVRAALERVLRGHLPYPAVVVDRHANLLSANAGFSALLDGVDARLLAQPVNLARVLLRPDGLASRIVNLNDWAWHVLDRLDSERIRNPDEQLDALIAELVSVAPPRPRDVPADHLGFAVPLRLRAGPADARELRLITTLTHFGTAIDVTLAELRLEAFLPADDATAALLNEMVGPLVAAEHTQAAPPTYRSTDSRSEA